MNIERLREPMIGGSVAGGLLLLAVLIVLFRSGDEGAPPPRMTAAYWYDLNTGKLFRGPRDGVLPMDAPSGPLQGEPRDLAGKAGVRAFVLGCGGCEPSQLHITYLEYYPQPIWKLANSMDEDDRQEIEESVMVRSPEPGSKWLPRASDEGLRLVKERLALPCQSSQPCAPP